MYITYLIWRMDTTAKGAKKNTSQYVVHKQNIITPFYYALHKKLYIYKMYNKLHMSVGDNTVRYVEKENRWKE